MKTYFAIFFLLISLTLSAQQQTAPAAPAPHESKAWKEMGAPGPKHKDLEQLVGKWTTSSKLLMGEAPAEAGTAEGKMILGGRFLYLETTGTQMGKPYTTVKLTGYDNVEKIYQSTWVDDEHTEILQMKGVSQDGKTFTFLGSFHDPEKKPVILKSILRIKDKNHHTWEYYGIQNGKEVKMVEVTYTRAAE